MTAGEFKAARLSFGLTQEEFAKALRVGKRTLVGWESGVTKSGRAYAVPATIALLVGFAIRHPVIRTELGISS
jgi:DNA-binding transcriptional regulator YiaG